MLKSIMLPIAITTLATAGLTTVAAAQPVGGVIVRGLPPNDIRVQSKPVYYRDLDLTSRAGARTLFHRIRNAAAEACDPRPAHLDNLRDYTDYQDFARCEMNGITVAVAEVNSPALSRFVDGLRQ
jgi:UrcA family protein